MSEQRRLDEGLRRKRRGELMSPMSAASVLQSFRQQPWSGRLSSDEYRRLAEVLLRIEAVVRSLGRDQTTKIAPGREWAYYQETNTVLVPVEELLSQPPEKSVAIAIHEATHRRISRLDAVPELSTESLRLLLNAVEDPRVNNWITLKYQGVRKNYMEPLYNGLFPRDMEPSHETYFQLNLPHVQFSLGIIHYWFHGGDLPAIDRENVRAALRKTRDAVERAYSTVPPTENPDEREIWRAAHKAYEVVRREIWPAYHRLVEESKEIIERGLRDGTIAFSEDGLPSGLSGNELSEKARSLAEQASRKLADALEGRVPRSRVEGRGTRHRDPRAAEGPADSGSREGSPLRSPSAGHLRSPPARHPGADDREIAARQRNIARFRQSLSTSYDTLFDEVAPLVEELAGFLEAILEPNAGPRREGFFRTGTSIHIPRLAQLRASGAPERDVFMRRTRLVSREYRFSLLLDESASMLAGGKARNVLLAAVLFLEVAERLQILNEIVGFHSTHLIHKSYAQQPSPVAKEELIQEILRSMGGGATQDVAAVRRALHRMAEERVPESYILVITDGEGNGPGSMSQALERSRREGVALIGIGVGEGVEHVPRQYAEYVTVPRILDLPAALGEKIEEVIRRS